MAGLTKTYQHQKRVVGVKTHALSASFVLLAFALQASASEKLQ